MELVPFSRPSERAARKIPPLEGRVASGVSRKPDDGRGDLRSASAFVETNCDPVRHLFRRLRRHLPLEGKDLGAELVPFLRPSKDTAFRYDTSSVACGDTFPSRGRTWGQTSFRSCVRRSGLRVRSLPLRGGWHPASPASRMTEEVIFVALLHPSKRATIRYDTSSVACGDTFPSRGRTGWNSSRFCIRRKKLLFGTSPLPSPAATPSPQGEGLGGTRCASASVGAGCA